MTAADRMRQMLIERTPLSNRATRKRLVHGRRRAFEAVGSERFSRPGHAELDAKLQRYLPTTGTFVEAGANDGYTWSNTYYLERWRGWSGVLVEGIPDLAAECRALRTRSHVVNCALVAEDFPAPTVTMTFSDLKSEISDGGAVAEGQVLLVPGDTYEVEVRARTLSDVLDEAGGGRPDFISLDLEGYESSALRGLDLDRLGPEWLLIEVLDSDARGDVEDVLGERYVAAAELTGADVLYRRAVG